MRKHLKSYKLHLAVIACLAVLFSLAGVSFAMTHTKAVTLYDAAGSPIMAADADPITGALPAYSAEWSCGSCHTYANIEEHSYHAQLGANEQVGWASFNPNHTNPYLSGVAAKGKSWVQSPGHVGKW